MKRTTGTELPEAGRDRWRHAARQHGGISLRQIDQIGVASIPISAKADHNADRRVRVRPKPRGLSR